MALLPTRRSTSPISTFRSMLDDFFSEPFFSMHDRDITGTVWPRIDITEEDKDYVIRADMPGMDKKDIDVSVEGDTLTISGEKKEESKTSEGGYQHMERSYGSFSRSFALPDYVDKENVDASLKSGVLELRLKKTGEPKRNGKKIEVKS